MWKLAENSIPTYRLRFHLRISTGSPPVQAPLNREAPRLTISRHDPRRMNTTKDTKAHEGFSSKVSFVRQCVLGGGASLQLAECKLSPMQSEETVMLESFAQSVAGNSTRSARCPNT